MALEELSKLRDKIYTCTHCGNCKVFYEWGAGKNLYAAGCPSGDSFFFDIYYGSRGRSSAAKGLLSGKLKWTEGLAHPIFACQVCAGCQSMCEVDFKKYTIRTMETLRYEANKAGVGPLPNQKRFGEYVQREHNPYGDRHAERFAWLPKDLREKSSKKAEYLYFAGCTASYRQKNIAQATVQLFKNLGLDFTVAEDEWCCGSPLLRTGQWDLAKTVAEHNASLLSKTKADKIVTTCAGCYRSLKMDYQKEVPEGYKEVLKVDFNVPVIHTAQLVEDLIKKGSLKLGDYKKRITYHDPCHLGRHAEVYDSPRNVLKSIPSVELIEMPRNRQYAWCCGAGGGVKSGIPEFAMETAVKRVEEAEATGAEVLASTCPFCWRNLDDAIKAKGSKLKMLDIAEIMAEIAKKK